MQGEVDVRGVDEGLRVVGVGVGRYREGGYEGWDREVRGGRRRGRGGAGAGRACRGLLGVGAGAVCDGAVCARGPLLVALGSGVSTESRGPGRSTPGRLRRGQLRDPGTQRTLMCRCLHPKHPFRDFLWLRLSIRFPLSPSAGFFDRGGIAPSKKKKHSGGGGL